MEATATIRFSVVVVLSTFATALIAATPTVRPLSLPVLFEPAIEAGGSFVIRGGPEILRITRDGRLLPTSSARRNGSVQFAPHGCSKLQAEEFAGSYSNYFLGRDPSKWRKGVPQFRRLVCQEAYPGIDLAFYGNAGQLEFDYLVSPHANARAIRLHFEGDGRLQPQTDRTLRWIYDSGEISLGLPRVFEQDSDGLVVETQGVRYQIQDHTARIDVSRVARDRSLRIDPVITYSTFVGSGDQAYAAAVAPDGSIVLTGIIEAAQLPTHNAVQQHFGGWRDAFVTKLSPDGGGLTFSTYFGGSNDERGYGVAIDAEGYIYVAGTTFSSDFPVRNAYQQTCGGCGPPNTGAPGDAFLLKLSPDGSDVLFSTYLGGNGLGIDGHDAAYAVAVDRGAGVYVTGATRSIDFPITAGALQPKLGTTSGIPCGMPYNPISEQELCGNAFVAKFTKSGSLTYSTYLGGRGDGGATGIAVDSGGNAWIVGSTIADDFPTTANAVQRCNSTDALCWNGYSNAFVAELNATGSGLLYSTILGSSYDHDYGKAIAIDGVDNVYVAGTAGMTTPNNANFPVTTGALKQLCTVVTDICWSDIFITKFASSGHLIYSTRVFPVYLVPIGGPYGLAPDAEGNVYFAGFDFPWPQTREVNRLQPCEAEGGVPAGFLGAVNSAGSALTFSSCIGSPSTRIYALAHQGESESVFLAGSSLTGLPTTPLAFQNLVQPSSRPSVFAMRIDPSNQSQLALTQYKIEFEGFYLVGEPNLGHITIEAFNLGSIPLPLQLQVEGSDFHEADDCGASIAAADQCSITLTFSPSVVGDRSGQLRLLSGSRELVAVPLKGTGSRPDITATPSRLDFGNVPVGVTSTPLQVVFSNSAAFTPGTIYNIGMAGDFVQSNNCNYAIPSSSPCIVNVTFRPTASGPRTGSLTLYSSGLGSPAVVELNGVGTQVRRRAVRR